MIRTYQILKNDGLDICGSHSCCQNFWTMCSITGLQLFTSVFEYFGLVWRLETSKFMLIVWPISNFFRVLDVLAVLLFHTPLKCLFPCYRGRFDWMFLLSGTLGSGAGFSVFNDPLWEKVGTFLYESLDAVFALVYTMYVNGVDISGNVFNFISMCKIVSLGLNTALFFKSYIWVRSYIYTMGVGISLAVVVFTVCLVFQLRSMKVFTGVRYIILVIPLVVLIPIVGVTALIASRRNLGFKGSVFFSTKKSEGGNGEVDDDWDGECFKYYSDDGGSGKEKVSAMV